MKNLHKRPEASVYYIRECRKQKPDIPLDVVLEQMDWFEGLVWSIEDLVAEKVPTS